MKNITVTPESIIILMHNIAGNDPIIGTSINNLIGEFDLLHELRQGIICWDQFFPQLQKENRLGHFYSELMKIKKIYGFRKISE